MNLLDALIQQESGGRPGILGPQTRYGRAMGLTQMLPGTAAEMARKAGLPWNPAMMTDTSPQGADYQRTLGSQYLNQGMAATGNPRDALRYYHGGPNPAQWGPKTNAYADSVLARTSQPLIQPAKPAPQPAPVPQDAPLGMAQAPMIAPQPSAPLASMLPADPKIPHPKFFSKDGAGPALIAGLADGLRSLSGLPSEFLPLLAQQQGSEQQNNFDREKWNAELQAKRDEALAKAQEPPEAVQSALWLQSHPEQRNSVLSGMDALNPHYQESTDTQGNMHLRLAPRAQANTRQVGGQTYYLVNGEWYDNPEGR